MNVQLREGLTKVGFPLEGVAPRGAVEAQKRTISAFRKKRLQRQEHETEHKTVLRAILNLEKRLRGAKWVDVRIDLQTAYALQISYKSKEGNRGSVSLFCNPLWLDPFAFAQRL